MFIYYHIQPSPHTEFFQGKNNKIYFLILLLFVKNSDRMKLINVKTGAFKMVKELMHDPLFLAGKSDIATKEDLQVANDLLDTLIFHKESCVGMAANMIGVQKRIIAFFDESGKAPTYTVMLNPEIVKKDSVYDTEEGCLSLLGDPRPCKRYKTIKVQYQTLELQTRLKTYTGWTAQIIQHEIDHCNGILI